MLRHTLLPLLACLTLTLSPARADLKLWTATGPVRFLRDAQPQSTAAVHLFAARNEWESFQILLRSDQNAPGISIEPADLLGPAGATLKASTARIYRQHQMELTLPSVRNDKFIPGWYPDGLIPARHPITNQPLDGRLKAMPFDLPANQTHGFFIDLYIPADAKPGDYKATYRVKNSAGVSIDVPVTLTVWDFALPQTPSLKTSFGSPASNIRGYYRNRAKSGTEKEPADWPAVEQQCNQFMRDDRLAAHPASDLLMPEKRPDGTYAFSPNQVQALRDFIDTWHPNCLSVARPQHIVKDPEKERDRLRSFFAAFDALAKELNRPEVLFYTYLWDEPNDKEAYDGVRKWGKAVKDLNSVVKVLVVEQPQTQDPAWGDLYGAVDIWCPLFSLYEEEPARKRQALGEKIWTYTALCQRQPTPWWEIDFPLLNYRVPTWIAWHYQMEGLLYWGSLTHWKQVDDPWTDPKTYDKRKNGKGNLWNGEGVLAYPARPCGYDGIAPTLRLKALRDSVEDFEYLAILEKAGKRGQADKIVQSVARSWYDWDKDPSACTNARQKLAELILQKP